MCPLEVLFDASFTPNYVFSRLNWGPQINKKNAKQSLLTIQGSFTSSSLFSSSGRYSSLVYPDDKTKNYECWVHGWWRKNVFPYYLHIDFNSFQMRPNFYAIGICKKYCAYNLHAKINKQLEGDLNTCHLDVELGTLNPITTTNVINSIVPSTWEHVFPCGNECSQCIPNCTICTMGTTCVTKALECVSHIWENSMYPCLGTCTLFMWDDPMWEHTLNPTWETVDTLPMWEHASCANVQHGFPCGNMRSHVGVSMFLSMGTYIPCRKVCPNVFPIVT
jgi:hypothetical protein